MADRRTVSEYYTQMAKELIDTEEELAYLRNPPITIVYLESTHSKKAKGKYVLGQCEKVQEKNKWGIPADFTITIFEPNVVDLTEEQLKIVMFHELLHIDKEYEKTYPHDLEDFKYIIDRFGVDWAKPKKAAVVRAEQ
jgi:predicted metallopeptidase